MNRLVKCKEKSDGVQFAAPAYITLFFCFLLGFSKILAQTITPVPTPGVSPTPSASVPNPQNSLSSPSPTVTPNPKGEALSTIRLISLKDQVALLSYSNPKSPPKIGQIFTIKDKVTKDDLLKIEVTKWTTPGRALGKVTWKKEGFNFNIYKGKYIIQDEFSQNDLSSVSKTPFHSWMQCNEMTKYQFSYSKGVDSHLNLLVGFDVNREVSKSIHSLEFQLPCPRVATWINWLHLQAIYEQQSALSIEFREPSTELLQSADYQSKAYSLRSGLKVPFAFPIRGYVSLDYQWKSAHTSSLKFKSSETQNSVNYQFQTDENTPILKFGLNLWSNVWVESETFFPVNNKYQYKGDLAQPVLGTWKRLANKTQIGFLNLIWNRSYSPILVFGLGGNWNKETYKILDQQKAYQYFSLYGFLGLGISY